MAVAEPAPQQQRARLVQAGPRYSRRPMEEGVDLGVGLMFFAKEQARGATVGKIGASEPETPATTTADTGLCPRRKSPRGIRRSFSGRMRQPRARTLTF